MAAAEAEGQPGRLPQPSKHRSAVKQTYSLGKPSTPLGGPDKPSLKLSLGSRWMEQLHTCICKGLPPMLSLGLSFSAEQMLYGHIWRALQRYFQAG